MILECFSLKVNYNHVNQKLKEKLKTLMVKRYEGETS